MGRLVGGLVYLRKRLGQWEILPKMGNGEVGIRRTVNSSMANDETTFHILKSVPL